MDQSRTNKITYAALAGFLSLALLHLSWGFHFENYERVISYLISQVGEKAYRSPVLIDANFGVIVILCKVQSLFNQVSVYSIYKLSLIYFFLITLFYWCIKNYRLTGGVVFFCLICFVFLDSLIFINSNKIALLMLVSSFFIIDLNLKQKISFGLVFLCIILSVFNRIDISLIVISLVLLIGIVYQYKSVIKVYAYGFLTGIVGIGLFLSLVLLNVDNMKDFFTYERAIQDRKDCVIDKNPYVDRLSAEELLIFKAGHFILDKDHPVSYKNASIIKHPSIFSYLFKNKELPFIYIEKLSALKKDIIEGYGINLFLSILSLFYICYRQYKSRISMWKYILAILVYVIAPLSINLIASIETSFFTIYLLLPFILAIIIYTKQKREYERKNSLFAAFLLILGTVNYVFFTHKHYQDISYNNIESTAVFDSFKKQRELGEKKPVIARFQEFKGFLPSRLFYNYQKVNIKYLDAGALSHLDFFKQEFIKNFGSNYESLSHRVNEVSKEDGYFYCSKDFMTFMQIYFAELNGVRLIIEDSVPLNSYLNKYNFSLFVTKEREQGEKQVVF